MILTTLSASEFKIIGNFRSPIMASIAHPVSAHPSQRDRGPSECIVEAFVTGSRWSAPPVFLVVLDGSGRYREQSRRPIPEQFATNWNARGPVAPDVNFINTSGNESLRWPLFFLNDRRKFLLAANGHATRYSKTYARYEVGEVLQRCGSQELTCRDIKPAFLKLQWSPENTPRARCLTHPGINLFA